MKQIVPDRYELQLFDLRTTSAVPAVGRLAADDIDLHQLEIGRGGISDVGAR